MFENFLKELYMFGLGPSELLVVLVIVFFMFGAKRIPDIARGLGKGIAELKKATREIPEQQTASLDDHQPSNNQYPV
jgi:sec-independent protein translocase protein TatA